MLPEIWRDGDDAIYEVPSRDDSIVHVLDPALLTQSPVIDRVEVCRYTRALDDPGYPAVRFDRPAPGYIHIEAIVTAGQVVSVQENWHSGWRAEANGRPCRVRRDGLGLIVVEPICTGPCRIDLNYTGGAESFAARVLCIAAVLVCLALLRPRRRRPSSGD